MLRSGAGHCEVKGQLGSRAGHSQEEENLRESTERNATGGGGRRRAVRWLGVCGDGGMVLDIFSVNGEQGQERKNGTPENWFPPELIF